MKTLTKIVLVILAVAIVQTLLIVFLANCQSFKIWVLERNGVYHEISYSVSYASGDDCADGNINDEYLKRKMDFSAGQTYYMVVDFGFIVYSEKEDWQNINVRITVGPSNDISATLQDAATANFSERVEEDHTVINLTYKLPDELNVEKQYRIVVKLNFRTAATLQSNVTFSKDAGE